MAQPGNFTPILLYGSSTPGNVPLAANLTNSATGSEIAINVADKNLFFKDSGGTVNTVPIRQSSTSSNGWLSSTDWNTFNNKSNTNGTVTSVAALTLGTTGTDLSSTVANGTTTPVITLQVPTASATNRGALSAADWSTFNSKAPGVTFTANYIPFGQGTTTLNQSSSLTWDGSTFNAVGVIQAKTAAGGVFQLNSTAAGTSNTIGSYANNGTAFGDLNVSANSTIFLQTGVEAMRIFASGGVSIGNTTDPGAGNLSVTGSTSASLFNTATGGTSTLNNTATTIFTVPSGKTNWVYIVSADVTSGAPATYSCVYLVTSDNGVLRATALQSAPNTTITVSGLNIQATQISGSTQTVFWTVTRIS